MVKDAFRSTIVRQPERATRRGYRTGFQVAHQFVVTQGAKSVECLQMMQQYFNVGRLHCNRRYDNHKEHLYQFIVCKRSDLLSTIIPFFQRYPLRTSKRSDFDKFVMCMENRNERASHATWAARNRGDHSNNESP